MRALQGAKLLLVQPETPEGEPRGPVLLAIDSVGAGIGERVLVVIEGKAAGDALGRRGAPVDAAIVGIIDRVDDSRRSRPSRRWRPHDRRRSARARPPGGGAPPHGVRRRRRRRAAVPGTPAPGVHPSFGRYLLPREPGDSGACLIEPAVKCNHCGFCQSHGF